ncbi:methionine sulfoxide reductase A [Leptinotarsa decemlineata]|uniref:methionine sulfoxide reductase A n=1 Tax=Leptinotarsa decemlineata TaxID=7539 RepID=UPI003D3068B9
MCHPLLLRLLHGTQFVPLLIQQSHTKLAVQRISFCLEQTIRVALASIFYFRLSVRAGRLCGLVSLVSAGKHLVCQISVNVYCHSKMPSIIHEENTAFRKATFGMGCFWASDALFGGQQGVLRTRVGYSGGKTLDPVYRNLGDHTEVIEIDFDPKIISYDDLLQLFWNNHEYGLTTAVKRQYMSLILYHCEEQKIAAEVSLKKEQKQRNEPLRTEIARAGHFYPAEDYHQKYRLQKFKWICDELELTPELLQTSHVAARLNGYVAGVGTEEDFEDDVVKLGLPEKVADFVRDQLKDNAGGNLYC